MDQTKCSWVRIGRITLGRRKKIEEDEKQKLVALVGAGNLGERLRIRNVRCLKPLYLRERQMGNAFGRTPPGIEKYLLDILKKHPGLLPTRLARALVREI